MTPCTSPSDNLDPAAAVAAAAEVAVTSGGLELQQQQQTVSFSKITSKQKAKMQCQIDFQIAYPLDLTEVRKRLLGKIREESRL